MDITLTLDSASADLKIARGHEKNQNFDGMKACVDAAARRIDAVTDYAIKLSMVVPSRAMCLMLDCMQMQDDLADWAEMLSNFAEAAKSKVNASNYHERHKFFPGVQ